MCGCGLVLLINPAGVGYQLFQDRQSNLHLAGAAMPEFPRSGVSTPRFAAPAGQHLADLTVELGQPISQILGTTAQRLGEPLQHHKVDAQIFCSSHSGNVTTTARPDNSPAKPSVSTSRAQGTH